MFLTKSFKIKKLSVSIAMLSTAIGGSAVSISANAEPLQGDTSCITTAVKQGNGFDFYSPENSGVCVQREVINGDTFYKYTLSNDSATQINAATATINAVEQDLSEKADITYVDAQNNAQNTVIDSKASTADVKTKNDSQDALIAANTTRSTANQSNITSLQNSKADITYVNAQNNAQNTVIDSKASTADVKTKNDSQDALIAANTTRSTANQSNIT
ncbi:MAG: hypothetical protein VYA60_09650, partial [Pseudomonadota bacterium]|nr:hypothetical protein [Pseudomonadota bacterium]